MGQLTRLQIVTEGMRLAGMPVAAGATQANIWFNAWLRKTYRSWTWPFLYRTITGVALTAGTTTISFGAGSSGVTDEVQHIFDPIKVYSSDKRTLGIMRLRQLLDGSLFNDEDLIDWTQPGNRALPYAFRASPDPTLWGKWTIAPYPVADTNYLLKVQYLLQPSDISDDAARPIYPNDQTMIQAVKVDTLNYMHAYDAYGAEMNILDQMRTADKVMYGSVMGINDKMTLDGGVFRQRNDVPDWWKF